MRANSLHNLAACAALVVLAGCGATAPAKKTTTRVEPAPSGSYDFRKEGKVPAPANGSAQPETDVEEVAVTDSNIDVSEVEAPPDTLTRPAPTATVAADGFRIQLFASADREVAQNARSVASERLGLPAYLDLEEGVYKVRVGDFAKREDAAAALSAVRGKYYPDAWIVAARVNVQSR
jgi:hypothetical protein